MASVHILVIAARISRDCSGKGSSVHTDNMTSPNAERKFGVSVSGSPSLRSKKNLMGEWERDGGGLLTSTEEHHMKLLTTATLLKPSTLLMVAMSLNVVSSSALAKNHHSAAKSQDLGYAYSPLSAGDRNNTARSEAIRACNAEAIQRLANRSRNRVSGLYDTARPILRVTSRAQS